MASWTSQYFNSMDSFDSQEPGASFWPFSDVKRVSLAKDLYTFHRLSAEKNKSAQK
jgi:hypothetical protein